MIARCGSKQRRRVMFFLRALQKCMLYRGGIVRTARLCLFNGSTHGLVTVYRDES